MSDKTKLIIAVVCLALAGAAIAWQAGLFSSGPVGASDTAADDFEEPVDADDGQVPVGRNRVNLPE